MTIENAILEALIQDIRNMEQIYMYILDVHGMDIEPTELRKTVRKLLSEKFLEVVSTYDEGPRGNVLDFCWIELTADGEDECIKRDLMLTVEEYIHDIIEVRGRRGESCSGDDLKKAISQNYKRFDKEKPKDIIENLEDEGKIPRCTRCWDGSADLTIET